MGFSQGNLRWVTKEKVNPEGCDGQVCQGGSQFGGHNIPGRTLRPCSWQSKDVGQDRTGLAAVTLTVSPAWGPLEALSPRSGPQAFILLS